MPVQYPLGVMKEHVHTREKAGLFDVSHMGQAKLTAHQGDAAVLLKSLCRRHYLVERRVYALYAIDRR